MVTIIVSFVAFVTFIVVGFSFVTWLTNREHKKPVVD